MRQKSELIFSAAIALLAGFWIWEARDLPQNARLFPWTIGFPLAALALFQFGQSAAALIRARSEKSESAATVSPQLGPPDMTGLDLTSAGAVAATATAELAEVGPAVPPDVARARALAMFAWILVFFAAILLLGFRVGAPLITFLFLTYAARESLKLTLAFTLVTYVVLVAADTSHMITLSTGMIAQALGLESLDAYLVNPIIRLLRGSPG